MNTQRGFEPHRIVINDQLAPLEPQWQRLSAHGTNIFATWEWASLWCEYFGAGHPLRLVTAHNAAGEVAAILPLYLSTARPVRVARFVGHGPADLLGPVCEDASRDLARDTLAHDINGADWDLLIAECLPAQERWLVELAAAPISSGAFPVVTIGDDKWDDYLAHGTRNFRQKIGWRTRRLHRSYDVEMRVCTDACRLDDDFATLVELHRARWGSEGAFQGSLYAFHRDFTRVAFANGWLRLWIVELDGKPAAAALVFRYGNVDFFYQMGRDREFDNDAVGFVLTAHVIRDAFDSGVSEFRLLRGDEHYKRRFANADPGLQTIAIPRTRLGRSAIGVARIASRSRLRRAAAVIT